MALIIKGDMPTKCCECRFCNKFGDYPVCIAIPMKVEADEIFPKGCPILGEIPDKHGDLIERSKVHEAITQAYCLEDVPSIIDQLVPTVLEAST